MGMAAAYRVYFLNAANHIRDVAVLDCQSDGEAIEAAKRFAGRYELELWDRARLVSRLPRTAEG